MALVVQTKVGELAVAVSPKAGSSSVVAWLKEVAHGHPPRRDCIHTPFLRNCETVSVAEMRGLRVAIHRDGVERLVSAYKQWVPKARYPTLLDYARDAAAARGVSSLVGHHTRPQADCLGRSVECYDVVWPMNRLDELPRVVGRLMGGAFPAMPKHNVAPVGNSRCRGEARELLVAFTEEDTEIGWDGVTEVVRV